MFGLVRNRGGLESNGSDYMKRGKKETMYVIFKGLTSGNETPILLATIPLSHSVAELLHHLGNKRAVEFLERIDGEDICGFASGDESQLVVIDRRPDAHRHQLHAHRLQFGHHFANQCVLGLAAVAIGEDDQILGHVLRVAALVGKHSQSLAHRLAGGRASLEIIDAADLRSQCAFARLRRSNEVQGLGDFVRELNELDSRLGRSEVQFIHESRDEFQRFLEIALADAVAAIEQNHRVQLGRQTFLRDFETAGFLAILALEISFAVADVSSFVREAITAVLARVSVARVDHDRLVASASGPASVADAGRRDAADDAFAVVAIESGAVIDLLAAMGAFPSFAAAANGAVVVVDASAVAAIDFVAGIQDVSLADEAHFGPAIVVVPSRSTGHLLQATLVSEKIIRHELAPMTFDGLTVEPTEVAAFSSADPPSISPWRKDGNFPEDAKADVGFDGVFVDVLTRKLVSLVALSVGQRAALALALHASLVEVFLVLGEAEAQVVWSSHVVHRAKATFAYAEGVDRDAGEQQRNQWKRHFCSLL